MAGSGQPCSARTHCRMHNELTTVVAGTDGNIYQYGHNALVGYLAVAKSYGVAS